MANHFYVYEHWRPDTGQCFYVGKGTAKRAWAFGNRPVHHKRIRSKLQGMGLDIEVRIIGRDLMEADAFIQEIATIAEYRKSGNYIINLTNGGEGSFGLPCSDERKAKISKANTGRVFTAEHKAKLSAWVRTEETRRKIGLAGVGRKHRLGKTISEDTKARLKELGHERIETFKKFAHLGPQASSRRVVCVDDGKEFPSASAAARHYDVSKSALIELCLGKNYSQKVGGLVFKYTEAA